ncbi:MAG TPA: ammonium transporter [bacterium]|nr:ammonium transporter [bacterium]
MMRKMDWKLQLSIALILGIGAVVFHPVLALALDGKIDGKAVEAGKYAMDTVWVVLTAVLVFFMQAGFACVEAGFTRAKNTVNIMMKNFLDFCMSSLAYWAIGFGLMFGNGNALFGLTGFFTAAGTGDQYSALNWTSVPTLSAWFFQLVFAGTAATIVSGAMAERTKFGAYLIYSFVISLLIYPVIGHWIWGGGWLASLGMLDFAGSTVVHSVGGWLALSGVLLLGPRMGKYSKDGSVNPIPGHNIGLATLGTFILWMGWFGFNPGSTMAADAAGIAITAVTTNIAAAAGAIDAMAVAWARFKKPDVGMTLNGALAGLVGITASAFFVTPLAAVIIGLLSGTAVVYGVLFFERRGIDDPVGAISVHGVCGALGTILLGFFHTEKGLLYAADSAAALRFLAIQGGGVLAVFVTAMASGLLLFKLLQITLGLRVSPEEEFGGLDLGEHGASAYPDFQPVTIGRHPSGVGHLGEQHAPVPSLAPAPAAMESGLRS